MSRPDTCNAHDFIVSASALSSPCLDLSKKGITQLPSEFPGCGKLECLYLEGNKLCVLPESLFTSCPNLRWLDLRNNRLVSLPPSIITLRCLRTLLLEGNQLTTLPPQLGQLCRLTGLNLSRNPLQSPPQHVVRRGTKAVLQYLCGQMSECQGSEEEEREEDTGDSPVSPSTPIPSTCSIATARTRTDAPQAAPALPVWGPLMRSATLHIQSEPARQPSGVPREATPTTHRSRKEKRRRKTRVRLGGREREGAWRNPSALTAEDQHETAAAIERQRSQQCLEDWRQETREVQSQQLRVHLGHRHSHLWPMQTAPTFTVEEGNGPLVEGHSPAQLRLEAMDGLHHGRQRSLPGSANSLRDAREYEVTERVQKYTLELRERRRQAGLICNPSSELLEAERRLAEAMARRKELEVVREYRLTAFTGDLPLGH